MRQRLGCYLFISSCFLSSVYFVFVRFFRDGMFSFLNVKAKWGIFHGVLHFGYFCSNFITHWSAGILSSMQIDQNSELFWEFPTFSYLLIPNKQWRILVYSYEVISSLIGKRNVNSVRLLIAHFLLGYALLFTKLATLARSARLLPPHTLIDWFGRVLFFLIQFAGKSLARSLARSECGSIDRSIHPSIVACIGRWVDRSIEQMPECANVWNVSSASKSNTTTAIIIIIIIIISALPKCLLFRFPPGGLWHGIPDKVGMLAWDSSFTKASSIDRQGCLIPSAAAAAAKRNLKHTGNILSFPYHRARKRERERQLMIF